MSEEKSKLSKTLATFMDDRNNNDAQKRLLLALTMRPVFEEVMPRGYSYAMIQVMLHEARGELETQLLNRDDAILWEPLREANLRLGDVLPLLAELPLAVTMIAPEDSTFTAGYRAIGEQLLGQKLEGEHVTLAYQGTGYLANMAAEQLSTVWAKKEAGSMETVLATMAIFVAEYLNATVPGLLTHYGQPDAFYKDFVTRALMEVVEHPDISLPVAYNTAVLKCLFPTIEKISRHYGQFNQCLALAKETSQNGHVDARILDASFYHYILADSAF
jgi:hypothetical protein